MDLSQQSVSLLFDRGNRALVLEADIFAILPLPVVAVVVDFLGRELRRDIVGALVDLVFVRLLFETGSRVLYSANPSA